MTRILLNWPYHRQDLTDYLFKLTNEFELIFIYDYASPGNNQISWLENKKVSIVYWGDYNSPYQLLKIVRPDIVVFHDIEAFNQIALNVASRNMRITTFVLQHGVRGKYEIDEALTYAEKQPFHISKTSAWSFKFFLSAFRFKNIPDIFSICKFLFKRKRSELTVALNKSKAEWRNADYYIELSKNNTGYHKMRDGIPDDRFYIIGNPQFDSYFEQLNTTVKQTTEPYALLIDAPFCEPVFLRKELMTVLKKNEYLKNINSWCLLRRLKLFVKLHPLTYNADYLMNDQNIVYHREVPLAKLINESAVVLFVHFSTLTPLIMHYKPFIYLTTHFLPQVDFIKRMHIQASNLEDFSLELNREPSPPLSLTELEDQLYRVDGKATERLINILRRTQSFQYR